MAGWKVQGSDTGGDTMTSDPGVGKEGGAGQGREQVGWGCLRGCCPKGSAGQRRTLPALGPAQSRSTLQWPSHDPWGVAQ